MNHHHEAASDPEPDCSTMVVQRVAIDSPIGRLTLVARGEALSAILFPNADPDRPAPPVYEEGADRPGPAVLTAAAGQLQEYFTGSRTTFDLPLDIGGSEFEREVWQALLTIPYGQTISYGRQAELIGRPGAARAVGAANGRNRLPIVLPCHRVVGADGALTGFGGGLDTKRLLLELESGTRRLPF